MKLIINGNEFVANEAKTVYDAAKEAELISRAVIAAKVNGSVCALSREINEGDEIELENVICPCVTGRVVRIGAGCTSPGSERLRPV